MTTGPTKLRVSLPKAPCRGTVAGGRAPPGWTEGVGPESYDGSLTSPGRAFAALEWPRGVELLWGRKQGLRTLARLSVSFLVLPCCRRLIRHDIRCSPSLSSDQRRLCVLVILSHTTSGVQARRCRHPCQVPPGKHGLQVLSQGSGVATPQPCTFSSGGRKGGGSRELGYSHSALGA